MPKQTVERKKDVQQQHVDMHRKLLMRRHMLRFARPGAAYVPFIGDGDIAVELYGDRTIYGADLDPERVDVARTRLRGDIRVADCDGWPFPDLEDPIAIADFDAYVEPYVGFRAFMEHAPKTDQLVCFFTDGRKQGLMRTGYWTAPDGTHYDLNQTPGDKQRVYHAYLTKHVWPWFQDYLLDHGWVTQAKWRYQRAMMIYWAAAIRRI